MKVMLLENMDKLGKVGELVDVSDGYARNFLLPKKKAKIVNSEVINDAKNKKASEDWHLEQRKQEANKHKEKIDKLKISLVIGRDKITSKSIADAINEQFHIGLNKNKIDAYELKAAPGEYKLKVRFMPGITATITVLVMNKD